MSKKKPGKDTEKDKAQGRMVEGVPESFLRSSKLCIAYQKGTCDEPAAHTIGTSSTVLALLCRVLEAGQIGICGPLHKKLP